ncbi:GpE family phage tail protein [Rhodomicrobium lacus]
MADLATVFHWPLSELLELTPQELLFWRGLAEERVKAK